MEIMNSAEIKLELFRRIDNLKGKALEEAYQHMLSFLNKSDVNPELQSGMERTLKDVEEGRVSSHEDVMKSMKKKNPLPDDCIDWPV